MKAPVFPLAFALALTACNPVDGKYAAMREKLDRVARAGDHETFDLGETDAEFLKGRPKTEILAKLGEPRLCDEPFGKPCAQSSRWVYFFCHHTPGYRGGGTTLVLDFTGETC